MKKKMDLRILFAFLFEEKKNIFNFIFYFLFHNKLNACTFFLRRMYDAA